MSAASRSTGWRAAVAIIERLRSAGHVAYLAGGCVRDRLLGREPKDHDVATSATPDEVLRVFPRSRKVGAKFGVVLVRQLGLSIEVATFRTDGTYTDGRRPDSVVFGSDREDALRRDFTINGLFLDPIDDRVIDHVGGQADLAARVIRTIGDPERRFGEDHLRMLRAVRFAAMTGFRLDPRTLSAIQELAPRLSVISAERIEQELHQILCAPTRVVGWSLLRKTELRRHLCPSWIDEGVDDDRAGRRLAGLPSAVTEAALSFASVWVELPSEHVAAVCRELRLSNRRTRSVGWLIGALTVIRRGAEIELADLKRIAADRDWPSLTLLFAADQQARGEPDQCYLAVMRRVAGIPPERISPPPLITGEDLLRLGAQPGPRFADVLSQVERKQMNEEIATYEEAIALARSLLSR